MRYLLLLTFTLFLYAKELSPTGYELLSGIQEDIAKSRYAKAKEDLLEYLQHPDIKGYEKAYIYLYLGYVNQLQADPLKAYDYYQKALNAHQLDKAQHIWLKRRSYRLLLMLKRYDKALATIDALLKESPKDKVLLHDKAYIFWQLGRYSEVISTIKRLNKPTLDELEMLYFAYRQNREYRGALDSVIELLQHNMDSTRYWSYLFDIYLLLEDRPYYIGAMELSLLSGAVDKSQVYESLAYNLVADGRAFEAADVMQKGLDGGYIEQNRALKEFIADCYLQAKAYDRALDGYALLKSEAYSQRLAEKMIYSYYQLHQYAKVIEEANEALKHFKIVSKATLTLLAQSYIYLGKRAEGERILKGIKTSNMLQ